MSISAPAAQQLHTALRREAEHLTANGSSPAIKAAAAQFLAMPQEARIAFGMLVVSAIANDPFLNLSKKRL